MVDIARNIESRLVFSNGKGICLQSSRQAILNCKSPDNRGFVNDCQQDGLELDYIQFGCVVQLEKLMVKMTRQQSGLNLDSGYNTPGDTNQSQVDILST